MAQVIHWGVDSAWPATGKVTWNNKRITLYEYVVERLDREPEFWGRYIGGNHAVTAKEIDYIFTKSHGACRVLPIYNGAGPTSVQGGRQFGVWDAVKAIQAADALDVPPGVMLWCDIEGAWRPGQGWFLGWWETMYISRYAGMGGIYCRANLEQFYRPYVKALEQTLQGPQKTMYTLNPFAPGPDQKVLHVMPVDAARARLLWTTRPMKTHWAHPSTDAFQFTPANPPTLPGHVALWQYHQDFLKQSANSAYGLIDMDLADERAYAVMWQEGTFVLQDKTSQAGEAVTAV